MGGVVLSRAVVPERTFPNGPAGVTAGRVLGGSGGGWRVSVWDGKAELGRMQPPPQDGPGREAEADQASVKYSQAQG